MLITVKLLSFSLHSIFSILSAFIAIVFGWFAYMFCISFVFFDLLRFCRYGRWR